VILEGNSFAAEKKIAVLKALAEEKCHISPRRVRKLGEDVAEVKRMRCVKRKTAELWWTFLRQKEPVKVRDLVVRLEGSEVKIEKERGV